MRHGTRIKLIVLLGLLIGAAGVAPASGPLVWMAQAQEPGILYAKPAASGSGDCGTWDDACTLQSALAGASPGDEIWVAEGIHKPGIDPTATFQLVGGVELYGGFVGAETLRTQRDWATHPTVLSGDIDGNDLTDPNGVITDTAKISGNNSYHVVTGSGVTETAVLDGVIVSGGNANGSFVDPCGPACGGGMYSEGGSPTLSNITFSGNAAFASCGGMCNLAGSNPTLTDVTFSGNTVGYRGGGMCNAYGSSPMLVNVTFNGNTANLDGGGILNLESSPTLTHVTLSGNATNYDGGGMFNWESSPTLTHCTVTGNTADLDGDGIGGGGGIYQQGGLAQLKNTIVASNGLGANSTALGPDLWGDFTSLGYNLIGNADDATGFGVTGDLVGSGAAPLDPLLADLSLNPPGRTATHALLVGSPARDWIPYGVNGCGTEVTTDQRGVARPVPAGGACDVGAYEAWAYVIHLPLVLRNSISQ